MFGNFTGIILTLYLPLILNGTKSRSFLEIAVICGMIGVLFIFILTMKEDLKRT